MNEKRKRMALNSEYMPDEVYKILNEKALKRSLTTYVIELVEESLRSKGLLEKLDKIESKIDNILSKNLKFNENEAVNEIAPDSSQENSLKEGIMINVSTVLGGIDEDDKREADF